MRRVERTGGGAVAGRPLRDPELALLVACAAWPASPARVRAAADGIDWERFGRIVGRHRMAGMAAHGLAAAGVVVPPAPDAVLREAARENIAQALFLTREAARLVALFADAGIETTVLKGPPLAAVAYGTLAVRQLRDLDLLVAPGDVARAMALLAREGYRLQYAGSDRALRPDQSVVLKDAELRHPEAGLLVELHARLTENDALLPVATVADGRASVTVAPGLALPALTGDALLLYLCVHGFRHGWHRLKWLADVAAIVAGMDEAALAGFLARARAARLWVVVASTLLVLEGAMGFPLPVAALAQARRSRRARLCAAAALRHLADERDAEEQIAARWLISATRLLASPGPRYLLAEAVQVLVDRNVAITLGGGRAALAASVALRPLALPARALGKLWRDRQVDTSAI